MMTFQFGDGGAALNVPYNCECISTRREKSLSIWIKDHMRNCIRVSCKRFTKSFSFGNIPKNNRSVIPTRHNRITVWRKVYTQYLAMMTNYMLDECSRSCIPYLKKSL